MPRIEFRAIGELIKWMEKLQKAERFFGYYTDSQEIILAPNRSTQPVLYALLDNVKEEDISKVQEATAIQFFRIKRWVWSADTPAEYVARGEL